MAGLLVFSVLPSFGHAQSGGGGLGLDLGKSLGDALVKKFQPRVQITPALTAISATHKSVTVTIANLTEDTLDVTLSLAARNRGRSTGLTLGTAATATGSPKGGRLLADSETSTKKDSIPEDSALVGWIRDLPPTLKLAPGEKESVTVKLDVPAAVKPGVYVAWVIASTPAPSGDKTNKSDESSTKVTIRDGAGASSVTGAARMMSTAAKLVYRIDTAP